MLMPIKPGNKVIKTINSHKAEIFTILSMVGVGLTMSCTVKATLRAEEAMRAKKDLTERERMRIFLKEFAKPIIVMCGTCASIYFGYKAGADKSNALLALLGTSLEASNKYAENVKMKYGEEAHKELLRQMVENDDAKFTFYDEATGKYYESSLRASMIDDDVECYIVNSKDSLE